MSRISIEGGMVTATSPEGATDQMPLDQFLRELAPTQSDFGQVALPPGTRSRLIPSRRHAVLVHETAPRVHNFRWIAGDSPKKFGPGTTYREVRIALPYVIVVVVLRRGQNGRLSLSEANECFFSNQPLKTLDQPLSYPALLNCSKFTPPDGKPLSWICTQHLKHERRPHDRDPSKQLWGEVRALLRCLFETGFNYSSEHHEGSSWFTESTKIDPRIQTVEAWEKATECNKSFVLDLPWLPTGLTASEIVARTFRNLDDGTHDPKSVEDLARIVFNHKPSAQS